VATPEFGASGHGIKRRWLKGYTQNITKYYKPVYHSKVTRKIEQLIRSQRVRGPVPMAGDASATLASKLLRKRLHKLSVCKHYTTDER